MLYEGKEKFVQKQKSPFTKPLITNKKENNPFDYRKMTFEVSKVDVKSAEEREKFL